MTTSPDSTTGALWTRSVELFRTYGHFVALTFVMLALFVSRTVGYERYLRDDGTVMFRGNASWYHYREVKYALEHGFTTMPMDPWTGYPEGNSLGQFGTLFDQGLAAIAFVLGMGAPSDELVRWILLFSSPVIAVLVAIPTYLLAKRVAGGRKWTGVVAVGLLAVFPGTFFERSTVGFVSTDIVEVLLMTAAVLSITVALTTAREEFPVWEVIRSRELTSMRGTLVWGLATGLVTALLMWVWPSGVLFVGIAGVFFVVKAIQSSVTQRTAEPTLIVGAISMFTAGGLMLPALEHMTFDSTHYSLLQVALPLGIAIGCVYLGVVERFTESRGAQHIEYPVVVVGSGAGVFGMLYLLVPEVVEVLWSNVLRTFGLGVHADPWLTVQDAQPLVFSGGVRTLVFEYGGVVFLALLGLLLLMYRGLRYNADEPFFIAVWGVLIGLAAFTQMRFQYYLAVVVAIFAAYALQVAVFHLDITWTTPRDVRGYQALALIAILLMIVPVLLFPPSVTVLGAMADHSPGTYEQWDDSVDWLSEDTPKVGTLEGADNELDYYGTYEYTSNFEYEEGSYGVLSWGDYGHWITVEGERIPIATPVQQHAEESAEYLLATSEDEADAVLTEMDADAEARYVMVDWQMVHPESKFMGISMTHPTADVGLYLDPLYVSHQQDGMESPQMEYIGQLRTQMYYETLMVRLYHAHGSAMEPEPLVVDYDTGSQVATLPQDRPLVQQYQTLDEAREAVSNNGSAHVGGIGPHPRESVDALEHYRLVHASDASAMESAEFAEQTQKLGIMAGANPMTLITDHPNWVKTFERVPGATVEGNAPENSTVQASVDVEMPHSSETFTYTSYAHAGDDGEFELVVPYSTTGGDQWGADNGYTEPATTVHGPYTFETVVVDEDPEDESAVLTHWVDTAEVTEGQVIGEDMSSIDVELSEGESEEFDDWASEAPDVPE